jgi:PilZ domain-containing protein
MSVTPKFRIGACTRELPRYCSLQDLSLTYEGQSENVAVHPPDLSPKGMFINTPVHFPEGSVLKVSFRLARSNHRIETRCEVRYCMPGLGVGVEFIGIPASDQKAISEEIRSLGKRRGRRRKR